MLRPIGECSMKVHKIREIARKMGIDAGGKTKTDLVRAIQNEEFLS
jgi:hypothetical protein